MTKRMCIQQFDSSTQELDEFVNTLTMPQMELISEYFASIPQFKKRLSLNVYRGKEINTTVQGLNNFSSSFLMIV